MKVLTKEQILRDTNGKVGLLGCSIFMIAGIFATIMPFAFTGKITETTVVATIITFASFGVPLGYFVGYRNIHKILKMMGKMRRNEFSVVEDIVTNKEMRSGTDDNYCALKFKDFSPKNNKIYPVRRSVYMKTSVGDKFYLIFLNDESFPLNIYSTKEYIYCNM